MESWLDTLSEDWDSIKRRYEHWWANDLYDRALLQVRAPREGVPPAEPWPGGEVTPEVRWTSISHMTWYSERLIETTFYGGEALPQFHIGPSAGMAIIMGCEPHYEEETIWVEPLAPVEEYPELRLEPDRLEWLYDAFAHAGRSSRGRHWIRDGYSNHAGDTLALIRGTERLLIDMLEDPLWVKAAVKRTSDLLLQVFKELWHWVGPEVTGMEGYLNWAGIWSQGRNFCTDCDISCMISPKLFEEMFLPPLVETMRSVEHNIYHLDGPNALQHLDALLSLPELEAIQWAPGAGLESVMQWVPLVRRIQGAGKSLQLSMRPEEVGPFLAEVPARGILIGTRCSSEEEARDLLRLVAR